MFHDSHSIPLKYIIISARKIIDEVPALASPKPLSVTDAEETSCVSQEWRFDFKVGTGLIFLVYNQEFLGSTASEFLV